MRERSGSDLTTAIHSPGDDGYILDRTRAVLGLYFDPDRAPDDRAAAIEEYRRALTMFPKWAVAGAFDDWVRTRTRRPAPGEIAILAMARMKPLTDELLRRKAAEADGRPDGRVIITAERRAEIMAEVGFRFGGSDRGQQDDQRRPHWSETAAPDDPRWEGLRKARAENPLMHTSYRAETRGAE